MLIRFLAGYINNVTFPASESDLYTPCTPRPRHQVRGINVQMYNSESDLITMYSHSQGRRTCGNVQ